MVSMALLDYLVARGVSTMLIESDTSNPDVCKTYKDVLPWELLDPDKVDGWIQLVNACDAHRDIVTGSSWSILPLGATPALQASGAH